MKICLIAILLIMATHLSAESLIIGIAGGTGSGKTTLAHKIQEAICDHSVLISQDFYYKDLSHLSKEERESVNFDHPDSIDFKLMRSHIEKLKRGEAIECPQYDFKTHTRRADTLVIEPARVIVVEGILLFAVSELKPNLRPSNRAYSRLFSL